jgi:hypothetical protein
MLLPEDERYSSNSGSVEGSNNSSSDSSSSERSNYIEPLRKGCLQFI